MAAELNLYNDIDNLLLVRGYNDSSQVTWDRWFQGSSIVLRYWPVRRIENKQTPPYYNGIAVAGLSLEVAVGPKAGAASLLAYTNTFTPVISPVGGTAGYLTGTLNLNTSQMNTAVGSNASISTWVEIILNDSGDKRPVFQAEVTVHASVVDPTGAVSLPESVDQYLTRVEIEAMYCKKVNTDAFDLILRSPGDVWGRQIGVQDDGTPTDNVITL